MDWFLYDNGLCHKRVNHSTFNQGRESGVRLIITRSSHQRWSVKRGALKNFANFTGKRLCWSLFLTMLQSFNPVTFFKRDSNTGILLQSLGNFYNTYFEEPLRTTASVSRFSSSVLMWEHHFWRYVVNVRSLVKEITRKWRDLWKITGKLFTKE